MEKDDEHTQGKYDFGARIYDSRIGRWLAIDPHASLYASTSSYCFVENKPIIAVDPDGRDVYLVIWSTDFANGSFGHAAIAVSNYKAVEVQKARIVWQTSPTNDNIKVPVLETYTVTEYVEDGTYTYYDLWPADAVGSGKDGYTDASGNQVAGATDNVNADYQNKKLLADGTIIDENVLLNTDVSEREEGKLPNGVIKINTDYAEDNALKEKIDTYIKENNQYNGAENNCSDFAGFVMGNVLDTEEAKDFGDLGKEWFWFSTFSTPNELFKDSKELINTGNGDAVMKESGDFSQPFITNESSGGNGHSMPDK